MSIRAVIFDLDGTLTEPFLDFDAIRREIGIPEDGPPILEAMGKMGERERRRAEQILVAHEALAVEHSRLHPGARLTLARLRRRGILIGVLTRNRRDNVAVVADKHGLRVDCIVGREDGPVKPDAFGVLEICRQFGIPPRHTLVVGDYLFDLLSANAAGAISVLLTSHPKADRFKAHAVCSIGNLPELLQIIDREEDLQPRASLES